MQRCGASYPADHYIILVQLDHYTLSIKSEQSDFDCREKDLNRLDA